MSNGKRERDRGRTEVLLDTAAERSRRERRSPRRNLDRTTRRIHPPYTRSRTRLVEPVSRRVVFIKDDVDGRFLEEVRLGELGVKVGDTIVRVDVGLEGRRDLARSEGVPVYDLEEGVFLQLGGIAGGS